MLIDEPRFEALAQERGLTWEDRDGFGLDYAETLAHVARALRRGRRREAASPASTTRFHDLWRYYLMYCEGGFRGGGIDVAQVTLSKVASLRPGTGCRSSASPSSRSRIAAATTSGGLSARGSSPGKASLAHPGAGRAGVDDLDAELAGVRGLVGIGAEQGLERRLRRAIAAPEGARLARRPRR